MNHSPDRLFKEAAGFVQRVFEEMEKSSPEQCLALKNLMEQEDSTIRLVIEVVGNPVISCFAIVGDKTHLVAAQTLSAKPRVLN